MNAIFFLLKEHDKFRKMFADIANQTHKSSTKKDLFAVLCQELIRHETMEQKLWYPQLQENDKLNEIVQHLIKEEQSAAKAIKDFANIHDEKEWNKKFEKLKNDVEHHAEEEETRLFPKVDMILSSEQLDLIGKKMQTFKKDFDDHIQRAA